jgi:DNA-binding HxlR family transcriptional regulator
MTPQHARKEGRCYRYYVSMLTLRGLERDGLVSRKVTPTIPPRVDYELTALGKSLQTPVIALGQWAYENLSHIHAARAAFDTTGKVR